MRTQVRSTIDSIKSCGEPFCSPYGFGSRRLRPDGDSEKLLVVEAHTMMIYRIPFTRLAPRNPAAMHRLDRISNSAYIYVERYRRVGGFDQNLRSAHLNQEKCLMELRPNSPRPLYRRRSSAEGCGTPGIREALHRFPAIKTLVFQRKHDPAPLHPRAWRDHDRSQADKGQERLYLFANSRADRTACPQTTTRPFLNADSRRT
jgi:hypothetical protein